MKKEEKITHLQNNHLGDWIKTRQAVEDEMSKQQMPFCICGRLATGFHESSCRKFQGKVQAETILRLKHLLKV